MMDGAAARGVTTIVEMTGVKNDRRSSAHMVAAHELTCVN